MTRYLLPVVAFALASTTSGFAQPIPPTGIPQRPAFSPYLSLLNGNGNAALNYFGLVLPQQQFQQQAGQLQVQLNNASADFQSLQLQNRQLANGLIDVFLPQTGNVATFNNTGNYFNRIGGGGIGAGAFNRGLGGRPGGISGFQPSFARPAIGTGGSGLNRPAFGGVGGFGR